MLFFALNQQNQTGITMCSILRNVAVVSGASAMTLFAEFALPALAQAAYVVTLQQIGPDVVATGSGTIDTTGFIKGSSSIVTDPMINAKGGMITLGQTNAAPFWNAPGFQGPMSFGTGGAIPANSGTGSLIGLTPTGSLQLPSIPPPSDLSSGATWDNQTFASLGVTPGTYAWTWGTGAHADSFTLQISPMESAPEPGTVALMAVGLAGLGVALRTRRG